jgi:two-component system, LuxR family, sensor kinase FixL
MIDYHTLMQRFYDLQKYVGWQPGDSERIRELAPHIREHFPAIIDDFYLEIERHPEAKRVITGGQPQIDRLKSTLLLWLEDLFSGNYDADYVARHWRIGRRHVEISLLQVYVFAALSRLRQRLTDLVCHGTQFSWDEKAAFLASLQRLLDIDAALIQSAYDEELLSQQQAYERLRSDTLFRNVVDSAGCIMLIVRRNGTIAFANAFADKVAHIVANDQIADHFVNQFVVIEDREKFTAKLQRSLAGETVQDFEACLMNQLEQHHPILWNFRPLENYEEELVVLIVGQDISTLHQAQSQALQAERLAIIGRMSAGLAHEARNTLQRMQACSEMLEFEVGSNREALDLLKRMQTAQDELLSMFEDVKGYAGPVKLDLALHDVRDAWREAWQLLQRERRERDVTFTEHVVCDVSCYIDRFRMTQLFRNLFENSLAACSDPVEISVHCEPTSLHGQPAVQISVCDNGPGLNAEQRQRIFEPFYTTRTRGTGLGMAIAQRIVETHGGTISLGNSRQRGAEIIVTLLLRTSV